MVSPKSTEQLDGGKKLSLTSMYFNRYLVFRYATAIFFFTNLYWLVILAGSSSFAWIVPAVLLLGSGAVMVEQVSKYWKRQNNLSVTRGYYLAQAVINLLIILSVALGQRSVLYPFLTDKSNGVVIVLLTLGIVISLLLEHRGCLIEHDRDRYLKHIKQFAASL